MSEDELDGLLSEIEDELVDYAVPVWMVPAWVRGAFRSLDEASVYEASARICEVLLSRDHLGLVWIQGRFDKPWPDGPKTLHIAAPKAVTLDMFEGSADLITTDPYVAIDRVR